MQPGIYEIVVQKALETVCSGPWTVAHLINLDWVIDPAFCEKFGPDCDANKMNDWLKSLSEVDRRELIQRLNENLKRMT